MRSFDQSFSSSDPILVLPPQHPSFNMDQRPHFTTPFSNSITQSPVNSAWSNHVPTLPTPASAAGRKRSRDDAASNLEDDYFPVQAPTTQPEPDNEDEWEYGEGMTLIKPNRSGYVLEAGSQTGTWAEEKAEEEKAKAALAAKTPERPIIRPAKSQRLNLTSTPAIAEEADNGRMFDAASSPERFSEPTVDDFTRHLGIGWSSVSTADPDIQAAARGWAKFIENHFPITNVHIRLQSKGLASYLVEANEGYFLFGEDLKQGRLVSTNLEKVWINLREPVPVFDGEVVMEAGETPKIVDGAMLNGVQGMNWVDEASVSTHAMTNGSDVTSTAPEVANGGQQSVEVEMDMS